MVTKKYQKERKIFKLVSGFDQKAVGQVKKSNFSQKRECIAGVLVIRFSV